MDDNERKFYMSAVRWGCLIVLSIIWATAIYNYLDVAGPIRPKQTMQYYWPK